MSKQLFKEFPEVSSTEWKQLIQFDLKGLDYNNTLIWSTNEGIDVKPFYHADEFKTPPKVSQTKATQWLICQTIFVANVEKSNEKAVNAIENGATSIKFIIPSETVVLKDLLVNINLSEVEVNIECLFNNAKFYTQLATLPSEAKIVVNNDIIGHLAQTGNWFDNLKIDYEHFESIVYQTTSITVNTALYQNAGATMVQQLAYALAHANEYLNHFDKRISDKEKATITFTFNMAVGANYFFEIAKLRALRNLWSALALCYGFDAKCHIIATPTKRNKTLYDYNTNLLRSTTECMSAILGGANTISNLPYDAIYHKDNEFGERIARNQLLILKHESYFDKVNNPADGAYYIESLTSQLAEKALKLFKDIESNGGFLHQLKKGIIQKKIKESADKEQKQFDKGELILLGTNKHPNKNDRMKDNLELYPFVKTNPIKTLIAPVIEKRLAEAIEQKRLNDE